MPVQAASLVQTATTQAGAAQQLLAGQLPLQLAAPAGAAQPAFLIQNQYGQQQVVTVSTFYIFSAINLKI